MLSELYLEPYQSIYYNTCKNPGNSNKLIINNIEDITIPTIANGLRPLFCLHRQNIPAAIATKLLISNGNATLSRCLNLKQVCKIASKASIKDNKPQSVDFFVLVIIAFYCYLSNFQQDCDSFFN